MIHRLIINFVVFALTLLVFTCDNAVTDTDTDVIDENEDGYDDRDIQLLQDFIDNSILTINVAQDTISIYGNENGFVEPIELGYQIWENGRITVLDCSSGICGLSGNIPEDIGNLNNLIILYLFGNQLSGKIPESIGFLNNLRSLYLNDNQLSGDIPEHIGNFNKLHSLRLNDNLLTGIIPESICNIYSSLEDFSIINNQLCPPYPDCIPWFEIFEQDITNCNE